MAPDDAPIRPGTTTDDTVVAAERFLLSLRARGLTRLFANLGTDHGPLLEAATDLRERGRGDEIPRFVVCPHEFAAMSAAHGHAVTTGEPQAVLVHVDVGTQNLGAAMHNAHRSGVPILVFAGLAPVTDDGFLGSRNNVVQYVQDVFDQPGIVREYCRWTGQFQPPEDPDRLVARALERATDVPPGPAYLTATREALETPVRPAPGDRRTVQSISRPPADAAVIDDLVRAVEAAEAPLLVTGGGTSPDEAHDLETLVDFAETAGVGVVEHAPTRLSFPRTHDLHVGFEPASHFDVADLVLAVDVAVPWVPWQGAPADDATTVQLDATPTMPSYPRWNFAFDRRIAAAPTPTLAAATERLDPGDGTSARSTWRTRHESRVAGARRTVEEHRDTDRLTPAVVSATLDDLVDERTVLVNDATTSGRSVLSQVGLDAAGSYRASWGAGLGWGPSAAVGVKLAAPEQRVVALVGDGSYVFANPSASAWLAAAQDAPTLTVVYNNAGWNAVRLSTLSQHPSGAVASATLPESTFAPRLDLSHPAKVVGAHTSTVDAPADLRPALEAALAAVDGGTTAVLDVHLEAV